MLAPKIAFFDELDTGVDVDALKTIAGFLKENLPKECVAIFITHSTRILNVLKPDVVLVLRDGRLVKQGTGKLAQEIERKGFNQF